MKRRTLLQAIAALPLLNMGVARAFAETADPAAAALAEGVPGVGGAVFTADETLYLGVAGVRRLGADDAILPDDKWHLGSNVKAMTAALYQRLVEQGVIKDGASLAELFPDVTVDPALRDLKADDLAGHRAGLTDAAGLGTQWLMTARGDTRPLDVQRAELAARALSAPPPGPVGTFAYANINFIVQGAAIEQATGRAWEEVIASEMFAPLGITSAGFGPPPDPAPWGHMGSRPMEPGIAADNPLAIGPAGSGHMNLADYGKWLQMILRGGEGWLSEAAIAAMTAPPAAGETYRRGWGVVPDRPWAKGPVLVHEGSNMMWHAVAMIAPVRGVAIVGVSNSGLAGAQAAQGLAQKLKETYAPV